MRKNRPDAKTSKITKSQLSENVSNLRCSISPSSNADNAGVKETNDINVTPAQFDHPRKADGGFLTLGVGGGTEITSNHNFNTRNNSSEFEEADLAKHNNYLVRQDVVNPSSVAQMMDRTLRFQTSASGLSNSIGRMSTSEDGGSITCDNTWRSSNPYCSFRTQHADMQRNFSFNVDSNSGFQYGRAPLPLPSPSPAPFLLPSPAPFLSPWPASAPLLSPWPAPFPAPPLPAPLPLPLRRTMMFDTAHAMSSPLGSDHYKPAFSANQPIYRRRQNSFRKKSVNGLPESSTSFHFDGRQRGNSIRHSQLGRLIPPTDSRETQITGTAPFPVPSQALGSPQAGLDSHFTHLGSTTSSDRQKQVMPAELSKDFSRVDDTRGQVIPVAKVGIPSHVSPIPYHQSLKRRASDAHLATRLSQLKKIIPQSTSHLYTPQKKRSVPAPIAAPSPISARTFASPHHVKWKGFDGPPKLNGQKCHLCKRDLSFTAEGSVYQPDTPPDVAVLPCGHTFHDQCLQNITPEDQSSHPPCIPCAMGET